MKMILRKIVVSAFITTIFYNSSCAQAKFTATISPLSIGKDETAQLTFQVENGQQVEDLRAPELKDFIVISGPNQQSDMQIINGVVKQSLGISYVIKPKTTGTFNIGEAS